MAAARAREVTPERWARIKDVVAEAIETPREAREAYLDRACAGDRALREEVESLLAASDGPDSIPGARGAIARAARGVVSERDEELSSLLSRALGQQYELIRPLGKGGMGAVYLARERALERFVAIKVLRPELADATESLERFRREARTAAQLSHPSIIPLHTFGEVNGVWYFVMGYARGESLAERLRLEGRISWAETHRILLELVDALDCAHRHGVVHRDIKPGNILLEAETGHAMLADFGIAKTSGAGDSLTATGVIIGTPDYMSPEQALGLPDVDERSDLYSLGAVAYRMLAGREPFAATTTDGAIYKRVADEPPHLKAVCPGVPDALAEVVMQCLARDRALRFASAGALREALVHARGDSPERLPESVRDLPSFGAYALLWVVAWSTFALLPLRPASERALLLLIAFLVPLGLALHVWNVGRPGMPLRELARVAAWPPEWWGMWWPRALRRPSDLWPRLPAAARVVRGALSAFFLAMPGVVLLRQWLVETGRVLDPERTLNWFIAGEVGVVVAVAGIVTVALGWARQRGLSTGESVKLLFGATTDSPAWSTPAIARLLAAPPVPVRGPEHDVAADHLRAIRELRPTLAPDLRDAAGMALTVADRLAREIEQRDAELTALARDASVNEIDRLSAKLATLDAPVTRDDPDRGELRDLLRHQLELVTRMRARRELKAQERTRLFDFLRALWVQLATARDAVEETAVIVGRVDALCREAAAALDGSPYGPITRREGRRSGSPTPPGRRG
jgi:serine/threonine protein kinase